MPTKCTVALLLIWSAALSGCALTGKAVSPPAICPDPPKPPPELMTPPSYENKVRLILFDSEHSAMPESGHGIPMPEP